MPPDPPRPPFSLPRPAASFPRAQLRAGASDEELAAAWQLAVASKLPGHGINDPGFLQPVRPMSAIGG